MTTQPPLTPRSLADLDDVRRKLEELLGTGRGADLIEMVLALLVEVRDTNTALSVRLQNALRALYGKRSEKVSTEQLSLLFAALGSELAQAGQAAQDPLAPPAPDGPVPPPPAPPAPPRGPHGRSPLPKDLPRTEKVVPVPEAERVCATCGADKICIGHRTSEILEFVPAHFLVIEEKRGIWSRISGGLY